MKIPMLGDTNHQISRDYGVLIEEEGIALRSGNHFSRFSPTTLTDQTSFCFSGLFIIDPKGILRQITINDLPVGRSVDETLRLVQAFQYTDKHGEGMGVVVGLSDNHNMDCRRIASPSFPMRAHRKTRRGKLAITIVIVALGLALALGRGGHLGGGVQRVENIPRSAWVKTDAASKRDVC
jgi:hypothetical protein